MEIDWSKAPKEATHYDTCIDMFCTVDGFWRPSGEYQTWSGPRPEVSSGEAADQFVQRPFPVEDHDPEYTGGSVSYYTIRVPEPTDPTRDQYDAECNDIIEALKMNYAEGNAFKALWRRAAARLGKQKRGYDGGLYDAEKVQFFGARLVEQSKQEKGND